MQEAQEVLLQSLGGEEPLEQEVATRSTILAWEIPWTEELGRLQSMGSQRVTQLSMHTVYYNKEKENAKEDNKC